jgi:hypothetical protein
MQRFFALLLILLVPASTFAVTTSHWNQTSEADFKTGTFHNVVATNLGDLKLSRSVKTLLELVEAKDGTIYAGTGPQGVLLSIKDDKITTLVELGEGINISSLLIDAHDRLLIGTGGQKGQVLRIDKPGDKPAPIFEAEDVQYIWAMTRSADGNIYLATGPNGQLFELKPDGSHAVILKTDDNNFTCMVSDGQDLLYVGTDPNGLVYRVNRKTHDSFVMYNATEGEIGALALDAKGNLYVGTAAASDQPAQPDDTGAKDKSGRPEAAPSGVPIQGDAPKNPTPPALPHPNPGQPDPIPKLMILTEDPGDQDPGAKPNPPAPAPVDPNPGEPQKPQPAQPNAKAGNGQSPAQQAPNPAGTGQPVSAGNAIYRIDPNGFVTEIFRAQVLVLSMVEQNGILTVATGSDGLVYQVNPAAEETLVIAKVDAKQVTTLLPTRDGKVLLGLSNVGGIAAMGSGFAPEGTYISQVFDATQVSKFGKLELHGSLPADTKLTVATRSGNVKEPSDTTWSKWSEESSATEFVQTHSASARFFQYRLTFTSSTPTASAVVEDVDVAYLMPNLAPQIKGVKVTAGSRAQQAAQQPDASGQAPPAPPAEPLGRIQTITWDASDPNSDPLLFTIEYRTGPAGPWILMKDKIKDNFFEWDTHGVADGRYQIKVTASDAAANPVGQGKTASRVSDAVLVDNTPPVIGDIKTSVKGNSVTVQLNAVDRTGTIASVEYAIDSSQDWQMATPSDTMWDAPESAATLTAAHLSPGSHQIAIRVTDNHGNQAFQNVTATVEKTGNQDH